MTALLLAAQIITATKGESRDKNPMSDLTVGILLFLIGSVVFFYSAWNLNFNVAWKWRWGFIPLFSGLVVSLCGARLILIWSVL